MEGSWSRFFLLIQLGSLWLLWSVYSNYRQCTGTANWLQRTTVAADRTVPNGPLHLAEELLNTCPPLSSSPLEGLEGGGGGEKEGSWKEREGEIGISILFASWGNFFFLFIFFSIFFSILLFRDILSATVDLCLIEPSFWVTKRFSIASNWSAWGFYLVFFCVCVCVCVLLLVKFWSRKMGGFLIFFFVGLVECDASGW